MTIASMLGAVEQRLASSRLAAFAALWILLVAQVIWTVVFCVRTRPAFSSIYYPVIFLPAAAALAITRGRVRWVAAIPRLLIGVAFVENVADRLGLLGPPGAPGVSWGDFSHFIAYTAQRGRAAGAHSTEDDGSGLTAMRLCGSLTERSHIAH